MKDLFQKAERSVTPSLCINSIVWTSGKLVLKA